MKNPWLELRQDIAKALCIEEKAIEEPDKFGDFAYPCFGMAKEQKRSPVEVARELAAKLRIRNVSKIEAVGPFLNFYVDWSSFSKVLLDSVDDDYGSWEENETVVLDVFNANPFKAFHIGHIRNAAMGESVRRLLEKTGRKAFSVSYNGDVGIHVARWMLYYNKFCMGMEIPKDFTKFSGEIYAKSSKMGSDDPKFEEEAQEMNRRIDQRDPAIMGDWKRFRDMCYKDYERIRNEMNMRVDKVIPESECEEPGKKTVLRFYEEGKIKKSEGALGLDLDAWKLGFFILLKSDGTAIYATKDIGLLQRKKESFSFDRMVYVVGSEQILYFQQLFRTFDILGLYPLEKSKHVPNGLVYLKEGKMSSRLGNVIMYDDLMGMMRKRILDEMREKGSEVADMEGTAKKIALGAVMFQLLDMENNKTIKFDWDQALDTQGRSGPYLQYSYVRALNILNKDTFKDYDASLLKEDAETKLLKNIAKFPAVVKNATDGYAPNVIANYLFNLAQDFNTFYQSVHVLKAEEKLKSARLRLVEAFSMVLKSGLYLLDIPVLEKM
jgi:arginyl-tRNA synthetase